MDAYCLRKKIAYQNGEDIKDLKYSLFFTIYKRGRSLENIKLSFFGLHTSSTSL